MKTHSLSRRIAYGSAAMLAVVCLCALTGEAAWAHGGPHVGLGVVIGPPYWGYYPYPPPYYYPYYPPSYYPPVVVAPQSPPVYVEKGQPAPAPAPQAPQAAVWYYCPSANGYYPYVQHCPNGWQTVAAHPPPPPPGQ
jgi:hypothetical protein